VTRLCGLVGGIARFGMTLALGVCLILLTTGLTAAADLKGYTLGAGDKLRITVYNETDLSGEFEVNGEGYVSVPLLGQIKVLGQTTNEVQTLLTQKYGKDYLVNPSVSIEVTNYRPFFIIGEVNRPGGYPYVNGMTIINAVALAGGYTPRANHDRIKVKHGSDTTAQQQEVKEDSAVLPGDVIEVPERFF
jgi:protein involved in polysaccharide export with SLBB domain